LGVLQRLRNYEDLSQTSDIANKHNISDLYFISGNTIMYRLIQFLTKMNWKGLDRENWKVSHRCGYELRWLTDIRFSSKGFSFGHYLISVT